MNHELLPGSIGEATVQVTAGNTAEAYGSGLLPVFSTPAMIALMEEAAVNCTGKYLEEGTTTVGTALNVRHLAATPMGLGVRARAELTEVSGRRLTFHVEAYDDREMIGEGTHERFIIQSDKFMTKVQTKR